MTKVSRRFIGLLPVARGLLGGRARHMRIIIREQLHQLLVFPFQIVVAVVGFEGGVLFDLLIFNKVALLFVFAAEAGEKRDVLSAAQVAVRRPRVGTGIPAADAAALG